MTKKDEILMKKTISQINNERNSLKNFTPNFDDGLLKKHNQEVYKKVVGGFSKRNKVLIEQATGTGKSYIAMKTIIDHGKGKKVLFVSPSDAIDVSFTDNLIKHLISKTIDTSNKSKKNKLKLIKEKLNIDFNSSLYQGLSKEVDNNYDLIIFDEVHRMGAKEWGKKAQALINNNPNAKILGMTATLDRPDRIDITEYFDNKKPVSRLTLVDAIKRKILPCPDYTLAKVDFSDYQEYIDNTTRELREKLKTAEPADKKQIIEFLTKLKKAKEMISECKDIPEILKGKLSAKKLKEGKFIVFCPSGNEDETESEESILKMHKIMDQTKDWFKKIGAEKINNYSVYSKQDQKINRNIIRNFENDSKKGVKLLFSINMLNEGLHVKDIDGVIMLRGTGSRIIYLQQLGRALSISENENSQPIIFDLVSNLNAIDIEQAVSVARDVNNPGNGDNDDGDGNDPHGDNEEMPKFKLRIENLKATEYCETLKKNIFDYYHDWFTPVYKYLVSLNGNYENLTGCKSKYNKNINRLRLAYKGKSTIKLTSEMIDKLNAINFPWEGRAKDWFTPFYKYLLSLNGNYKGIGSDEQFKNTVSAVRQAYKGKGHTKLTQEMIDKLNDINFPWEIKNKNWFNELYEYLISLNGNYKGITGKDNKFKYSISEIRQSYKNQGNYKLTPEMIAKLDEINFPWEVEKNDWFTPFYKHLTSLKGNYTGITAKNNKYHSIVGAVRQAYKGKPTIKLTGEMIDKLDSIGFPWEVSKKKNNNSNS